MFQHYIPKRDQAASWIKASTRQLLDDDYRRLSDGSKLLLHELRLAFALTRHRLAIGSRQLHDSFTIDTRELSHLLGHRVLTRQLEALNHAGLIEFVSRELLDRRLEKLYTGSRAEVELELEEELKPSGVDVGTNEGAPAADATDDISFPLPHILRPMPK